ncbi:MAG: N-acetylneuraminate synthase [Candidatus Daviesbacteria bacterium]|nr:N-acetylneuraminate synthase [Candidatus Daviesbacteria bacterium]
MIIKISKNKIGKGNSIFIIAEAGVNHNGKLDLALKLVDVAASAGADAVKFQTFKAEQVVTDKGEMADYQKKNLGKVESQQEMLKKLELHEEFYQPIIKRCKERKIMFLSTPHGGVESVDFLESLGVEAFKVGSGDLTNYLLLNRLARTHKPVILSSGMATLKEVINAVDFIKSKGCKQLAMLHCTTDYPCPPEKVNMASMVTMMKKLDIPVGYSDHTQGNSAAIMATTLGATIYECHFTVNKKLPGPDHIASASPEELKVRINSIREVEIMMGNAKKIPNESEIKLINIVRRSLVAASDLSKGHKLTIQDLEAKRPGDGISPSKYEQFLGKILKKSIQKNQQIKNSDIKH